MGILREAYPAYLFLYPYELVIHSCKEETRMQTLWEAHNVDIQFNNILSVTVETLIQVFINLAEESTLLAVRLITQGHKFTKGLVVELL